MGTPTFPTSDKEGAGDYRGGCGGGRRGRTGPTVVEEPARSTFLLTPRPSPPTSSALEVRTTGWIRFGGLVPPPTLVNESSSHP